MAARQDQTLQIVTICLIGLVVILGGSLIWVNRLKADYSQQLDAAKTDKSNADEAVRRITGEKDTLLNYLGFKDFDSLDEVIKQVEADQQKYGATLPEPDRNYRAMVDTFYLESQQNEQQASEAKDQAKKLEESLANRIAEMTKQIDEFKAQLAAVQQDAASEREKFNTARADLESKREELSASLSRQQSKFEEDLAKVNTQLSERDSKLTQSNQALERLIEERQQFEPSFEVADGRITWVNQRNQTVWINLGDSDSLARQVTFSVYGQEASDAGKAEKKASIEVIRILDGHLAEARITSDDARNPILPGDWIYSQVWDRGKKIHFALTGVIDIDGDGSSDLQQAKDLIGINGGVIDASLTEEGKVDGELSVETRYLVLGDFPTGTVDNAAELREGYSSMGDTAKTLGVETITLQQFLNQMGYKPLDRTVGLGAATEERDFMPKTGSTGKFRPRTPYATISP